MLCKSGVKAILESDKLILSKNGNKDKKNRACFHFGKKVHYIRKYRLLKNKKNDKEGNAIETNVIKDIVIMVSSIHIDMIIEVHMAMIANPFDWCQFWCNSACVQQQGAI